MTTATFPSQPSYGCLETEHLVVERIARDVEAMATQLIAASASVLSGGAITASKTLAAGRYYTIGTLSGNISLTLPAAGTANSHIYLLRAGTSAHTVAVGSLFTMPASVAGVVVLVSNGSAWVVETVTLGSLYAYATTSNALVAGAADGFALSSGTTPRTLSLTGGNLACTAPAAGAALTLTGDLIRVGAHSLTLTTGGATDITLPTTGTLATLSGAERMTGKVIGHTAAVATFVAGALTIQVTEGNVRYIDATAVNSDLTLGTVGAVAGDFIEIVRDTCGAHTVAIVNGGVGVGTLMTMTASKKAGCTVIFDGTNWRLVASYQEP